MPELVWDQRDLLECLCVDPERDEHGSSYSYRLTNDDIELQITVWPFESMLQVSVFHASHDASIMSLALAVRGGIERRVEKWGEYIRLRDCVAVPGRFSYLQMGDLFDGSKYPVGLSVEITAHPRIKIDLTAES